MAEGVGFEPTLGFPLSLISSQVPSTTQPPFHSFSAGIYFARFHAGGKRIRRTACCSGAGFQPGKVAARFGVRREAKRDAASGWRGARERVAERCADNSRRRSINTARLKNRAGIFSAPQSGWMGGYAIILRSRKHRLAKGIAAKKRKRHTTTRTSALLVPFCGYLICVQSYGLLCKGSRRVSPCILLFLRFIEPVFPDAQPLVSAVPALCSRRAWPG